jgi:ubiquitin-conjugating enzyme E2 D/E
MHFPNDYPFAMPDCYLVTKIYHCNVYGERGLVCLKAVKRMWGPHITTLAIVKSLQMALAEPDPDQAFLAECGYQCRNEREAYDQTARDWTSKYAQGPLPKCLEEQSLVVVLVSIRPSSTPCDPLTVICHDLAGEEIVSIRQDPRHDIKWLYEELAKHLMMPWWQLSLISQADGREIGYFRNLDETGGAAAAAVAADTASQERRSSTSSRSLGALLLQQQQTSTPARRESVSILNSERSSQSFRRRFNLLRALPNSVRRLTRSREPSAR